MSQKNRKLNFGSLKINHISLLNQSGFNFSLKKVFINQKNLEKLKEFLFNHKNSEKPVDVYLTSIQSINNSINIKENNFQSNPLTKKNKIIKKHNILKRIDFNTNPLKDSDFNYNKGTDLNLLTHTPHNNLTYNNNINSGNKVNETTLNLPLLTNNNKEKNGPSKIINNIHLYKYVNKSSPFINNNDLEYFNISSPSVKVFNNIKNKKKNIFTNEKIKNSYYGTERIKAKKNYTDKEIQTNLDEIMNNDGENKNIKKVYCFSNNKNEKNNKLNEEKDNESSSNDFDNIKEIENIISKSSINIHSNENGNNYQNYIKHNFNKNNYINVLNNSENDIDNKNEYILLKSLYKLKNDIKTNQFFEQSKTSRNIFLKTEQKTNQNSNISYLKKNINLFNSRKGYKDNKKLNKIKRIKDLGKLLLYDEKKKIIKKNEIYKILD